VTRPTSNKKKKWSLGKKTQNSDDNSACPVCRWGYVYDLKMRIGPEWIQQCFCLQWYHKKCENPFDGSEENIYLCSWYEDL
jgi:hypothetical protein